REGGVRRTGDGGRSWVDCELPAPGVFSLAVSPVDGAVYAGTEPSALFRSDDRGATWRELKALLELPSRPTWSFPPRPWTSHVRWIAPNPHDADVLLVGTATTHGPWRSSPTTLRLGTYPRAPARSPPTARETQRRASTPGAAARGQRSQEGFPSRSRRCRTRLSRPSVACSLALPTVS